MAEFFYIEKYKHKCNILNQPPKHKIMSTLLFSHPKKAYVFKTRILIPMITGIFILSMLYWVIGPTCDISPGQCKRIIGLGLLIVAFIAMSQSYCYYSFPPGEGKIINIVRQRSPIEEDYGEALEDVTYKFHRIYSRKIAKKEWLIQIEYY